MAEIVNDTTSYRLWEKFKSYKSESNLDRYVEEAQNFYNGDQYSNANVKNMIRITMNICSFAVSVKASKICGTPIYFKWVADNQVTDCTTLRQFDEYNCNKLRLSKSNYQATLNALTNGTEITYIAWDNDDTTFKGIYKGGLVEEHIDPRNFAVANPYCEEVQNQKWVMFRKVADVEAVKDMLETESEKDKKHKLTLIAQDAGFADYDEYVKQRNVNHKMVELFVRFFRIDGEVYFTVSTRAVDLFLTPKPLSRKVSKSIVEKVCKEYAKRVKELKMGKENPEDPQEEIADYLIDYENLVINAKDSKAFDDGDYKKIKEKFSLYPFAIYKPYAINGSFYGRSDIKGLISTQKLINFCLSMDAKSAENLAYNKILVKPDALNGQVITNEAGQVIVDNSQFNNGWGIKPMESQAIPSTYYDLADKILAFARKVYGFDDVMSGQISNQDLSGYAVQQMIKQNNTTIEQQQQLFWRYNEDKAFIRLLYYKHYVDKAKYTIELTDYEWEQSEMYRNALKMRQQQGKLNLPAQEGDFDRETNKVQVKKITNEEMYGINFDICIDAVQGLADSKLTEAQFWDNMVLNGGLQNIEPEYLELYMNCNPNITPQTKVTMKQQIEKLKQGKIAMLQQKLEQAVQVMSQMQQYTQSLEAKNGYQSEYLKNLQTEFAQKIGMQNKMISALNTDLQNANQSKQKSMNATSKEMNA